MSQGTPSTKQKLLEVAEELFATRGVEATLIGDIVQGAGQRNPSALRYHFGSREGVLQAIREKYLAELDRRRAELFEQWPGGDPSTPRDAVTLVVVPLVELLGSEGGRRYLRILGQTMYELNPDQMGAVAQYPSLARALDLMRGGMDEVPANLVEDRIRGALIVISEALATRARDTAGRRRAPNSIPDFRRNVIAMATALLTAPLDI
ncbi:TetR family transcriptional regulator [Rhodococcus hoagii]|nr:TetR family transcriptional regulator [Prescottella equi]NKR68681.1 TetR family transcriptional regulator [Prescottella equi]NKR69424.1 TetR family transcriptional regulator [Prescottella equi]NKS18350.1 TetR family transcriptional regulator [Prescottella equi]NKS20991.1 TetR family transcriptional regulator [Prescottella equi]